MTTPLLSDRDLLRGLRPAQLLAVVLYGEARDQPIEGKVAVACVARNRVASGHWGATYHNVLLALRQFSCLEPMGGAANYQTTIDAARTLYNNHAQGPTLRECVYVAEGIIAQALRDRTHGADHYVTAALYASHPPSWLAGQTPVCEIGAHVFFRLLPQESHP